MLSKIVSCVLPEDDLTLDYSILRVNVFIVKNPVIDDKKHPGRKSFEIVSTVKTKI